MRSPIEARLDRCKLPVSYVTSLRLSMRSQIEAASLIPRHRLLCLGLCGFPCAAQLKLQYQGSLHGATERSLRLSMRSPIEATTSVVSRTTRCKVSAAFHAQPN